MNHDLSSRDNLIALIGLSAAAAVYLFIVILPGQRETLSAKRQINAAEQMMQDVPLRVAELESLHRDIALRQDYLDRTAHLIPSQSGLHDVVAEVARAAERSRLRVTRLEPLTPVPHKSYRVLPFRLSVEGSFASIAQLLADLEQQPRLVTFDDLTVSRQGRKDSGAAQADLHFSVYALGEDAAGFAEDSRSSVRAGDDRQRR